MMKMHTHLTRLALLSCLLLASGFTFLTSVHAADYRWTGGAADGQWSTVGNWQVDDGGDWVAAVSQPGENDQVWLGGNFRLW